MVRKHFLLASLSLMSTMASAQDLHVMAWNINAGKQSLTELEQHAREALSEVGAIDVAILQEVISEEQVAAIARGFGLDHWAISDFSPPVSITGAWFRSLEVAVISRTPIRRAAEWDPTGRAPNGDDFPPRLSHPAVATEELPINVAFAEETPDRGFLRVDLEGDLSIYSVHWKSSRRENCTEADQANARQREEQAMGVAQDFGQILTNSATVIIGGDFNIQAPGRSPRVGTNPAEDCTPTGSCDGLCGLDGADGYDDSIAILLEAAPGVRLLSAELDNTFIGQFSQAEQSTTCSLLVRKLLSLAPRQHRRSTRHLSSAPTTVRY